MRVIIANGGIVTRQGAVSPQHVTKGSLNLLHGGADSSKKSLGERWRVMFYNR